jgi:membrane fusion protein (multidrug efflux system)
VAQREAQVQQAQAQLDSANLNLSYTEVRAPSDGFITKRNVQLGSYLPVGATMFLIVTPNFWITANFKEGQLGRMRPGDAVDVRVDAYNGVLLHGHVDSIQYGSGSRFSAFPTENATGNYVKIVQRVPVKIVIDSGLDPNAPLPLGLSVSPVVRLP